MAELDEEFDALDAPPAVEEVQSQVLDTKTLVIYLAIAIVPAFLRALLLKFSSHRHCHRQGQSPLSAATSPLTPRHSGHLNGRLLTTMTSTPRYGLALGEAASDSEDDEVEDDLTSKELRRLQQSPEFHTWCKNRKLTSRNLENTYQTLKLYKRLKILHPASFWLLCRKDTLLSLESIDPGFLLHFVEYMLSTIINVACGAALGWCAWQKKGELEWAACIAGVWLLSGRCWAGGRPTAGPLLGVWYEDVEWGHRASAVRAALASIIETFYLVMTAGAGALVSLALRWKGGQSVGEKIAGVKVVLEKTVRVDKQ